MDPDPGEELQDLEAHVVPVRTGSGSYSVLIGRGLLAELGSRTMSALAGRPIPLGPHPKALLVADAHLPPRLVELALRSLTSAGFKVYTLHNEATEEAKSLASLDVILRALARHKLDRAEPLIALGGGIIGDLAGFAAAVYRRGVPVIQCPTTLLAMVDASTGGKTGVNLALGSQPGDLKKNFVGAFHQPSLVLADVAALDSLPPRHARSGLAECIKHGMIAADFDDPNLFHDTVRFALLSTRERSAHGTPLITRNVRLKARVVGDDEREEAPASRGGRALLNLGHTFGHAIETIPGLAPTSDPADAPLHHGEAVALGLVAAAACAAAAGLCSPSVADAVKDAVSKAGLPVEIGNLPPAERLMELMADDKKVQAGRIRLVLPIGDRPGASAVVENPAPAAIRAGLAAIGSH